METRADPDDPRYAIEDPDYPTIWPNRRREGWYLEVRGEGNDVVVSGLPGSMEHLGFNFLLSASFRHEIHLDAYVRAVRGWFFFVHRGPDAVVDVLPEEPSGPRIRSFSHIAHPVEGARTSDALTPAPVVAVAWRRKRTTPDGLAVYVDVRPDQGRPPVDPLLFEAGLRLQEGAPWPEAREWPAVVYILGDVRALVGLARACLDLAHPQTAAGASLACPPVQYRQWHTYGFRLERQVERLMRPLPESAFELPD